MKRSGIGVFAAALAALAVGALGTSATADDDRGRRNSFKARLKAFDEVPSVSSVGRGELRLKIVDDDTAIEFKLTYRDLEGVVTTQAHIHLGQTHTNGGVSVFFCGGAEPPCTPDSGTFEGTITPADVLGPAGQGIAAGEFAELLRAIRSGNTYANVHTDKHPGGEIRGQIEAGGDDDDDDDD